MIISPVIPRGLFCKACVHHLRRFTLSRRRNFEDKGAAGQVTIILVQPVRSDPLGEGMMMMILIVFITNISKEETLSSCPGWQEGSCVCCARACSQRCLLFRWESLELPARPMAGR